MSKLKGPEYIKIVKYNVGEERPML